MVSQRSWSNRGAKPECKDTNLKPVLQNILWNMDLSEIHKNVSGKSSRNHRTNSCYSPFSFLNTKNNCKKIKDVVHHHHILIQFL